MKIVFSYDCEGNWGFVDWQKSPVAGHDPDRLEGVYDMLCKRHVELGIPATFAFVALYAMPVDARLGWVRAHLGHLVQSLPNLTAKGGLWEGHRNLARVQSASVEFAGIEVGSHGLTHRPILGLTPAEQVFEFERSAEILAAITGVTPRAFVYARNLITGQQTCLARYGAYRETAALTTLQRGVDLGRAVSGLDVPRSQITSDFIFWKGGHRRYFSDRGWKRLWRKRMRAARQGRDKNRQIHVWSHPHNFLTDPDLGDRHAWLMQLLHGNRAHLEFASLSGVENSTEDAA